MKMFSFLALRFSQIFQRTENLESARLKAAVFDFERDEKMKKNFGARVIGVVSKIKKGSVLTYKEVARRSGNEKAARAVGNILNRHYRDCKKIKQKTIPCHRVIRSDGQTGGYAEGKKEKRKLLEKEKAVL